MQLDRFRGSKPWILTGLIAVAACVALEVAFIAAASNDAVAPDFLRSAVIRIAVAVGAGLMLILGWPAASALGALYLLVPVGLYFLGAENHFLLIGVSHLVLLIASTVLAVQRFGRRGRAAI